jgi:hypothetical protein
MQLQANGAYGSCSHELYLNSGDGITDDDILFITDAKNPRIVQIALNFTSTIQKMGSGFS